MNLKNLIKDINAFEVFATEFIANSMESQTLGLEFDFILDTILENYIISKELAKDNILFSNVTGHNKIYLEEVNRELSIKKNLNDNELKIAKEQMACYKKELAYIDAVNHKVNIIRNLIKDNIF